MSVYECPQKLGKSDVSVYVTIHPSTDIFANTKISCIKELRSLTKLEGLEQAEDGEMVEAYDCLGLLHSKLSCDYLFEDPVNNKVLLYMDGRSLYQLKMSDLLVFAPTHTGIFTENDNFLL